MTSPILENFNTGEMSPMLAGRVGFEKYPNGASLLVNFIPTTQGPHVRRGGFRYVHPVKNESSRVLLIPFEYSVEQAYMLEFGDFYVRFYTWDAVTKVRGILESSPGHPVEVATPYSAASLYRTDGTPRINFAQSGDLLYLAHDLDRPHVLRRTSVTSFVLEPYMQKGGPWKTLVTDGATLTSTGTTGTVTITSNQDIFSAGHAGSLLYLEENAINTHPAWEVGKSIGMSEFRRSDGGKIYEATTDGTTGTLRPVHTEGEQYDGDPGVRWAYRHAGYGYVFIETIIDARTATCAVIDLLPTSVTTGTQRYAFGEWSDAEGWPSTVGFFNSRLWFARKMQAWGSVSDDFDDFSPKAFGEVTADMAISVRLSSGKINDIQWMVPDRDLLVGTAGGEFGITYLTTNEPMGPGNVRARSMSTFGSRAITPAKNGESVLFIHRSGLKARETYYDFGSDGYKSSDTTVLAEHITFSGITQMVFASDPDQVVWAIRADGRLVGFTWNNEQNVRGWHPHIVGGGGVVESIGVIPAAEGDRSELWAVVRRTINGQTRRYVEYMERPYRAGDAQTSQFYVDSGLTYTGASTKTIGGLDHLEGCEVSVLANGAPHPNVTVKSGHITLQLAATVAQIGLPCPARYRSMRLEAGAQNGTAQGKTKRIHKVGVRLMNTGGGVIGAMVDGALRDPLLLRKTSDRMDQPAPLFTGDKIVPWPQGYDTDGYLGFEVDQPVAATLVAFMPQVVTQDAR